MNRIKNLRPGILVLADASLKLRPGQVAEVERLTPHMRAALDSGRLALMEPPLAVDAGEERETTDEVGDPVLPMDLGKLTAVEAIERVAKFGSIRPPNLLLSGRVPWWSNRL